MQVEQSIDSQTEILADLHEKIENICQSNKDREDDDNQSETIK